MCNVVTTFRVSYFTVTVHGLVFFVVYHTCALGNIIHGNDVFTFCSF